MLCKNLKQPTQTYIDLCYNRIVKNHPYSKKRVIFLFSAERKVLPDGKANRETAAFH